ncbi:MAG: methyltransferase, partial [Janthinobacterium lividum]
MRLTPIIIAAAVAAATAMPAMAADLATILAGPQRSDTNRARDNYRHPGETLAFFGIKPAMTVVEISPEPGWYTEILAPYLRDGGHYIAAGANPATKNGAREAA